MIDPTSYFQQPRPHSLASGVPEVVRLDTVKPARVKWLWNQRLALGKLTLIAGDPGLGKSFLTLDLAARVSTGRAMPGENSDTSDNRRPPGSVVLLSAEDDPADTIRPRLEAAGADLRRAIVLTGVRTGGAINRFSLREHIKSLHLICKAQPQTRLIIIDPISAFLGDEQGYSNTKVRNLLAPLATFAQYYNVAVVAVTHLNKVGYGNAQSAIYRTMGSLAFTAAARTVHLVARDPDNADRRLLVPIKNNLGQDRTGYGFCLGPNADGETAIAWEDGPTKENADVLLDRLRRHRPHDADTPTKLDQAVAWLYALLKQGPVASSVLIQLAIGKGHSERTLYRARAVLDVMVRRVDDQWHCELPGDTVSVSRPGFSPASSWPPTDNVCGSTAAAGPRPGGRPAAICQDHDGLSARV